MGKATYESVRYCKKLDKFGFKDPLEEVEKDEIRSRNNNEGY